MTKEDVIAEVVLRDLKKRERLMQIVYQSGYQYYTGGSILGLALALVSTSLFTWLFLRENVPGWGFVVLIISVVGLQEATRQRGRFNALLELNELEKNEANKP